jgi:hypothetical protein
MRRVEDGTFGTCVVDGGRIEEQRVEAVPWTPYCLKHAHVTRPAERSSPTQEAISRRATGWAVLPQSVDKAGLITVICAGSRNGTNATHHRDARYSTFGPARTGRATATWRR